jgi:hypothetical protein
MHFEISDFCYARAALVRVGSRPVGDDPRKGFFNNL